MFSFGIIAVTFPLKITAAQLYSLKSTANGNPTIEIMSKSAVFSAISFTEAAASFMSFVCKKRSPQVYPVTQSSGKTITDASLSSAAFIISRIFSRFEMQSATFTVGLAAAILIKPSFISKPLP